MVGCPTFLCGYIDERTIVKCFRQKTKGAALAASVFISVLATVPSTAQTNVWTNSASGNWEDPNWSLGELPGPGQTILVTNAGWKAVAIGQNTSQNFPQALTVDSVVVGSPGTDTVNELLLNYAGTQVPLTANSLTVGTNCRVVLLSSALSVSNLSLSGTLTQDVNSVVSGTNAFFNIGDKGPATYALANGALSIVEATVGTSFPSQFIQSGGSNACWWVIVGPQSEFDLEDGIDTGGSVVNDGGIFRQIGGVVQSHGPDLGVNGTFIQSGGVHVGGEMNVPNLFTEGQYGAASAGVAIQIGGFNQQTNLELGYNLGAFIAPGVSPPTGSGDYRLTNGVLNTFQTMIDASGSMEQWGGTNMAYGLDLGGAVQITEFNTVGRLDWATYTLGNGLLAANVINIGGAAAFSQYGGTNDVGTEISLNSSVDPLGTFEGTYLITGGLLRSPSLAVSDRAELDQSGGLIVVSNILLSGATIDQQSGRIDQSGQLLMDSSTFYFGATNEQLGQLMLGNFGGTNSFFNLPAGPSVTRFADSTEQTWSTNANLIVQGWAGSLYGGGLNRLLFGNSSTSLTTQQVARITFMNPGGLVAGNHPARILSTGEIVPDIGAGLPAASFKAALVPFRSSIQLGFGGIIGQDYEIDVSSNLLDWTAWTNFQNLAGSMNFTAAITNSPAAFYRLRLAP